MPYTYPVCFIKRNSEYLVYLPDFQCKPVRTKRIEEAVVVSRKFLRDLLIQLKKSDTDFPKATEYDDIDISAVSEKFKVSTDDVLTNIIDVNLSKFPAAKRKIKSK